jgi:hypothetical protein
VADRPGQAVAGPSPWYTQVLLAPVMALVLLGCARWQRVGRPLASLITALWAWILLTSWTMKLFPMYSGGGTAGVRLRDWWRWRVDGATLSQTALAPAPWLYAGLAVAIVLTLAAGTMVVLGLARRRAAKG